MFAFRSKSYRSLAQHWDYLRQSWRGRVQFLCGSLLSTSLDHCLWIHPVWTVKEKDTRILVKWKHTSLLMSSTFKQTLPVIQNQNYFSCFESQLVIFSCLKVIQRADLSDLLCSTAAAALGVRDQGPSLRLQLLLLQGQFDGWGGKMNTRVCQMNASLNSNQQYLFCTTARGQSTFSQVLFICSFAGRICSDLSVGTLWFT